MIIDIVFDGPPEHEAGRFVEVESEGKSINFGQWLCRDDGYWVIRFEDKTTEIKLLLQDWINKQGHERCWYYPEIFRALCKCLGVVQTMSSDLPPEVEFEEGCNRYRKEEYESR